MLENGDIAPHIFNLNRKWRRVFSFSPHPLYPQKKETQTTPPFLQMEAWVGPKSHSEYFAQN